MNLIPKWLDNLIWDFAGYIFLLGLVAAGVAVISFVAGLVYGLWKLAH